MLDQQTDTTATTSVAEAGAPEDAAPEQSATNQAPEATEATDDSTEATSEAAAEEAVEEETTVVDNDLGGMSFEDAIDATIVAFDDGDIVTGEVVKIDSDEVLLDIGYKSEGVIPSKELSIRNDVDPNEVVSLGERLEALVLTKEDKDGRLVLSKKRAQYERAWGDIEAKKEAEGVVSGPVIEVVKGGLIIDIGLRGFLPASLVDLRRVRDLHPFIGRTLDCKIIELDKNRNNVVLSRRVPRRDAARTAGRVPHEPEAGRDPSGCRLVGRELRCVRRPRRHGRPRARLGAVVEARRPSFVGRAGR